MRIHCGICGKICDYDIEGIIKSDDIYELLEKRLQVTPEKEKFDTYIVYCKYPKCPKLENGMIITLPKEMAKPGEGTPIYRKARVGSDEQ